MITVDEMKLKSCHPIQLNIPSEKEKKLSPIPIDPILSASDTIGVYIFNIKTMCRMYSRQPLFLRLFYIFCSNFQPTFLIAQMHRGYKTNRNPILLQPILISMKFIPFFLKKQRTKNVSIIINFLLKLGGFNKRYHTDHLYPVLLYTILTSIHDTSRCSISCLRSAINQSINFI